MQRIASSGLTPKKGHTVDREAAKKLLGKTLRDLRESQDKSQEEVASDIGLGQKAISDLERGETDPSFTRLLEFARYFDVPTSALTPDGADEFGRGLEHAARVFKEEADRLQTRLEKERRTIQRAPTDERELTDAEERED